MSVVDIPAQAGSPMPVMGALAPRAWPLRVLAPAAVLFAIAAACLLLPPFLPPPIDGDVLEANQPWLTPGHLLGTDLNGNDTGVRLLHGGRLSFAIAIAVNAIGLVLGGTLGVLAAYRGGVVDTLIMRSLDILIAFPALVLVLAVAQTLGPGLFETIGALALFSIPAFARVARAVALRLREQPFVVAARLSGASDLRILLLHLGPNVAPALATFALLGMGGVILIEGALSFVGLGVRPPAPSWGNMIAHGQQALAVRPSLVLLPSTLLFATVLSFNLLGEALRARWARS